MPFLRLSEMTVSAVWWLVPYWLPRGKMVILDGNPGMGKSLITLDLCARVTTGRAVFADGEAGEPGNVVLLNAEDSGAASLPSAAAYCAGPIRWAWTRC
jgi:RecA-family ATPase